MVKDTHQEYASKKEYVNFSTLKAYLRSPLHYKYCTDPEEERVSTEALKFGRMYHTLLLEPLEFNKEFFVLKKEDMPEPTRDMRSASNRLFKKSIEEQGFEVVSEQAYNIASKMRDQLFTNYTVTKLLQELPGSPEQSIYLEDFHGVKSKCRIDRLLDKSVVDLKTVEDASTEGFLKQLLKYKYHVQLAFYIDQAKQFDGKERQGIFIVQEKRKPYAFHVIRLSDDFIEEGRKTYLKLIEIHKDCIKKGTWEGYNYFNSESRYGITTLELPEYLNTSITE